MRPTRLELSGFTSFREQTIVEFDGSDHGWKLLEPPHKQRAYAFLVGFLRSVTQ